VWGFMVLQAILSLYGILQTTRLASDDRGRDAPFPSLTRGWGGAEALCDHPH